MKQTSLVIFSTDFGLIEKHINTDKCYYFAKNFRLSGWSEQEK